MFYFTEEDLRGVFEIIGEHYAKREEVPNYWHEQDGINKLLGVFHGVQMDTFYPTLVDKATYLLTQINKGHFFSNGNKRLSLVIAIVFLAINDKRLADLSKKEYRDLLVNLFPSFTNFEDQEDFSPEEFATYNLSIIIADSHKYLSREGDNFEQLKQKVVLFFYQSLREVKE